MILWTFENYTTVGIASVHTLTSRLPTSTATKPPPQFDRVDSSSLLPAYCLSYSGQHNIPDRQTARVLL